MGRMEGLERLVEGEGEEDVLTRLRQLRVTLQECSSRVNRVDLALKLRTSSEDTFVYQKCIGKTMIESIKENGVALEKSDLNNTINDGDCTKDEDNSNDIINIIKIPMLLIEGTEEKNKDREEPSAIDSHRYNETGVAGNDSGVQENTRQRPHLVKQEKFELDDSEVGDELRVGSLTTTPSEDIIEQESHILSTSCTVNTGAKVHPSMDEEEVGRNTLDKHEANAKEVLDINIEHGHSFIDLGLGLMAPVDKQNYSAEKLTKTDKDKCENTFFETQRDPQHTRPESQHTALDTQPDFHLDSSGTSEVLKDLQQDEPETLPGLQQGILRTSKTFLDLQETCINPQNNPPKVQPNLRHDTPQDLDVKVQSSVAFRYPCNSEPLGYLDDPRTHESESFSASSRDTTENADIETLNTTNNVDIGTHWNLHRSFEEPELAVHETNRSRRGETVDELTDPRIQHTKYSTYHQQTWIQDVRRSLASVIVVLLLLFLLLFLACCLLLVVPVVTISFRTYGGPPAF